MQIDLFCDYLKLYLPVKKTNPAQKRLLNPLMCTDSNTDILKNQKIFAILFFVVFVFVVVIFVVHVLIVLILLLMLIVEFFLINIKKYLLYFQKKVFWPDETNLFAKKQIKKPYNMPTFC